VFWGDLIPARIFLWVGHPRATSLSHGLADSYQRGAEANGAEIRRMNLSDMTFDPDLTEGYHARKTLEPCLEAWRDNLLWANHVCWAYPQWWGGMPAKMKGVIDRSFLPGFAMKYHEKDPFWDRLLAGRRGDVLMTSDAPVWFDRLSNGRAAKLQVQKPVMKFVGIHPARILQVGPAKTAKEATLSKWMKRAERRGADAARRSR